MARSRFVGDAGLTARMTTVMFLLGALFVASDPLPAGSAGVEGALDALALSRFARCFFISARLDRLFAGTAVALMSLAASCAFFR